MTDAAFGPRADFDTSKPVPENVVFREVLDKRYQVEVQRLSKKLGEFCIFDHEDGDKLLVNRPVVLAFGAVFGADVEDADEWQRMAIHFIDTGTLPDKET